MAQNVFNPRVAVVIAKGKTGVRLRLSTSKVANDWLTDFFVTLFGQLLSVVTSYWKATCTRQGSNLQPCDPKSHIL